MKKMLSSVAAFVLFFTLSLTSASAACPDGDPLGYLSHKPLTFSNTPFGTGSTVYTATDHNPATGFDLPRHHYLTIDLGKEVSATALKVQASRAVEIQYYGAGRNLLSVTDATYFYGHGAADGTIKYMNEPVHNVRYISFTYAGSEPSVYIEELNIYGGAPVPWPEAPTALGAYATDAQVYLTWNWMEDVVSYNIKRSNTPEGPFVTVGSSVYESYTDFDVYNGQTFFYVVTAVDKHNGESPNSNIAWATPESRSADRGFLLVTLDTGQEREFDLSLWEIEEFTRWYEDRAEGKWPAAFAIDRNDSWGPFVARKEYLVFDKILYFKVNQYKY